MTKQTRHLIFAATLAAALAPAVAHAGFYSGDELYAVCTTDKDDKTFFEKSYECVGYISGAVDAFNTTREANKLKSCIPADVTISQLRKATVDYLGKNPKDRAKSASSQVFAATRKAWPCPAGKPATKKAGRKKR
ncbi:Rap1a/Tai family immunity protein [Sphingobium sp. HBC34]|uniref:Rap1a/Tai family immunity protein n=1 Tax=Sphingobium cyanobacteriorum TaxID=3063954 RepID=A0ABT8ZHE1_9SPHN|nr:Rap1a/Tai family immunity protein [Sphingobium sp. HBC34]MDO7833748.1 Rap1a/Tai family immunity protein [Sphingobium sp. HBC34]